ncbi:MAG: ribonuclease 3 [Candidatus Dojkabacteria bacterium]|nr:MAG: ribonuclease 3 [Candidatus Dojkabacteria bacterium]
MNDISELLTSLGIKTQNLELYRLALTHRSASKHHNERLEFLGDAVLELIITEKLFTDYANEKEGNLTSFRSAIVKAESLAQEALRLELGRYIRMSYGEEATGGRSRLYILANTFEALIGAMYLDQGYEATKEFVVRNLYYKIREVVDNRLDIDAKSKLQEMIQEKYKITPYYIVVQEEGPDHDKTFTVVTMIGDKTYAKGSGKSKQTAEQNAARNTLIQLGYIEDNVDKTGKSE